MCLMEVLLFSFIVLCGCAVSGNNRLHLLFPVIGQNIKMLVL